MPRKRSVDEYAKKWKDHGDWSNLSYAQMLQTKNERANIKPGTMYHGSPYKLKKGQKIEPKGPIFFGKGAERPAVHLTNKKGEARMYSKASDTGGINKNRYGKELKPRTFAKKGYVYEVKGKRTMPNAWSPDKWHHASYHAQDWSKRSSVRHKGRLPITKGEAAAGTAVALAAGGGYYYYRKRKGRQERVRNSNFNRRSNKFQRTHRKLR